MTAKDALLKELEYRKEQSSKLRQRIQEGLENDSEVAHSVQSLLNKVDMSIAGAEAAVAQPNWPNAFYLFAQVCWNLGNAHATASEL